MLLDIYIPTGKCKWNLADMVVKLSLLTHTRRNRYEYSSTAVSSTLAFFTLLHVYSCPHATRSGQWLKPPTSVTHKKSTPQAPSAVYSRMCACTSTSTAVHLGGFGACEILRALPKRAKNERK